ncbi:MAG: hypothetical protein JWN32_1909 [Solirubrobacterales bacterium]|nr:hypothetical protein [Solirubrobacterales bacterium]
MLDELRQAQERLAELAPLAAEYEELRQGAERLGIASAQTEKTIGTSKAATSGPTSVPALDAGRPAALASGVNLRGAARVLLLARVAARPTSFACL